MVCYEYFRAADEIPSITKILKGVYLPPCLSYTLSLPGGILLFLTREGIRKAV